MRGYDNVIQHAYLIRTRVQISQIHVNAWYRSPGILALGLKTIKETLATKVLIWRRTLCIKIIEVWKALKTSDTLTLITIGALQIKGNWCNLSSN